MDVSLMLADQVRLSQEEEARKFHSDNFENSHEIDLNHENHYLISNMFEEIGYLLDYPRTVYVQAAIRNCFTTFRENAEISILDFKRCYDVCSNVRIKNTRLQSSGYTSIYEYY